MSNSYNSANSSSVAAPAQEPSGPDMGAQVGAALGERFTIVRNLVESDTHPIYLARDLAHPEGLGPEPCGLVRLRVLSGSLAGDRRQVELFHLEANAAASLSHRNILKATPAEEKNGIHFYVTEDRPDAVTLREYLKRKGWLEEGEAVQIARQIADALEYAHAQGVLHLRLEPGEVLLDQSGNVLVGGFGIPRSKDLLWACQERSHYCAASHISPEQILSGAVDRRSDLYLLGIIFFEMLTDRAPFESEDHASLRLKQLTRIPKPPHMFRFDLSAGLSQIVMSLLGKRPDERPFDVSVFKSTLEQILAAEARAEEEPEEQSSLSREPDDRQSMPVEAPADLPRAPDTYRASDNVIVLPEPDTPKTLRLVEEKPEAVEDVAAVEDERAPDRDSVSVGVAAGLSESDDERACGDRIVIDLFEKREADTREPEWDEFIEAGAGPIQEERGRATYRPLAWLLVLLLIGGGLFGAIRGGRFMGKTENVVSGAEQQISNEVAASKPEAFVPTPEMAASAEAEEAKESTLKSEPATQAAGDTPSDNGEDRAAVAEKKEPAEEASAKPSPRTSSEAAPPSASPVEPTLMSKSEPPAEVKDIDLRDRQSLEPSPAPEQPAKTEPPAPKVIRRSGDVLQNTAIIRPRPVYPKAAREAKIRGSVTVELTINEEGSVVSARPIAGPEQLRDAAVAAARRWKWTPARVDRNRAGVVGTITFVFKD